MGILSNIDTNSSSDHLTPGRRNTICFASDDEDEDEDYESALGRKSSKKYNDDDSDESKDSEFLAIQGGKQKRKGRNTPYKKSNQTGKIVKSKKTPNPKARKRRRSSACFLRLSGGFDEEDESYDQSNGKNDKENKEKLGEMYRQALKMNAENKINAGNSWGLNLIENIDKFLGDDDDDNDVRSSKNMSSTGKSKNILRKATKERRVNFTKASCTLDASVKIYSYRVDDVHLTSYRVLANLNRTDGTKRTEKDATTGGDDPNSEDPYLHSERKKNIKRGVTNTLESNLANLNINKLDSAYDIDPIFHKMSRKFDEGGAKGLLLVNLGVACDGCRIVLDSKEDSTAENDNAVEKETNDEESKTIDEIHEGQIDISCLYNEIQNSLVSSPIESKQLVPQLEELRMNYASLESEGFINDNGDIIESTLYVNDEATEKAAEKEIHRGAMERSRASIGRNSSFNLYFGNSSSSSTIDDSGQDFYGSGDHIDDNEDHLFNDFVEMDETANKYSSESFQENELMEKPTSTNILDSLCTSGVLNRTNEYGYFNEKVLQELTSGNMWAGSAHWKKTNRSQNFKKAQPKNVESTCSKPKKKTGSKKLENSLFVDIKPSRCECVEIVLNKARKLRRQKKDSTQMTQAQKKKNHKENNLLPPDAEIDISKLSTLFLRPDATIKYPKNDCSKVQKNVGFHDEETFFCQGFDDGDDHSFGNDINGSSGINFDCNSPVKQFDETQHCGIQELEGVRKVDKVRVAYATVSKKVDVKRLKKDLWAEVESGIATLSINDSEEVAEEKEKEKEEKEEIEEKEEKEEKEGNDIEIESNKTEKNDILSFNQTVQSLSCSQAQEDVSVAYYFICMLHLANEKGLCLENEDNGLKDFSISRK